MVLRFVKTLQVILTILVFAQNSFLRPWVVFQLLQEWTCDLWHKQLESNVLDSETLTRLHAWDACDYNRS